MLTKGLKNTNEVKYFNAFRICMKNKKILKYENNNKK